MTSAPQPDTHPDTARQPEAGQDPLKAAIPYAAPMALFLLLTQLEALEPLQSLYPVVYTAKVVIVGLALAYFARAWKAEIRPQATVFLPAMAVGLVTLAQWGLLDKWIPYPTLGERTGFNPLLALPDPALRSGFLLVRFLGLALLVPLMEEVFWRSFLLRFLSDQEKWKSLPLGSFTPGAFLAVTAAFALAHPEWLVAAICAMLYAGLLRLTGSLFAVIVAHATTNLGLGIYVLLTGEWKYW